MLPEMIDAQAQAQAQAQAPAQEMVQAKAQENAQPGGRLLILQLGATNDASGTPDPDVLARCPITVALHRAAVAAGRAVTVRSRQSVSQSVSHYHIPSRKHMAHTRVALLSRVRVRWVSPDQT